MSQVAGYARFAATTHKTPVQTIGQLVECMLRISAGMNPKAEDLKKRTHAFFVRVIKLCDSLPQTAAARSIANQLLDSAGSTDSNYRAACRARSKKEFIAKLGIANEEADESVGWLRALLGAKLGKQTEVQDLIEEAAALVRIFSRSILTAKANLAAQNRQSINNRQSSNNQ